MLVDPGKQVIVEVTTILLQLSASQMAQVIVSLSNKLFSIEESINEKTSTRDLSWHPTVEARIKLALRHSATLYTSESRPMTDAKICDTRKQHLNHATAEVV